MDESLEELAKFVEKINVFKAAEEEIKKQICQIIKLNSATDWNINEYVCEKIFKIKREKGEGYDGIFEGELLQGCTVDFKYSCIHDCELNIKVTPPDYYLAIRGPKEGTTALYSIRYIFLLNSNDIKQKTSRTGNRIKVGDYSWWEQYQIYPAPIGEKAIIKELTDKQRMLLALFTDDK